MRQLEAEVVSDTVAQLGEGPIWDQTAHSLVWVDLIGQTIHRTDPESGVTQTTPAPAAPGAVAFGAQGQLLASLPDGLYDSEDWKLVAPIEQERPLTRCNDGRVDPWGRLVQGTMGWNAEPGMGALYRIYPDGGVEPLLDGLTISNGLAWSADNATIYHVETAEHSVRRFAYSRDGYLGPAAIVAEVDPSNGAPDGMTIDVDGCIWVALWGGQAVHRYTPDGELDTIIDVPVTNVTSCCFGGTDMATLFITTAGDFNDPVSSHSGKLFACQPGVSGWPENLFGI